METCKNDVSTLTAVIAEACEVQNSKGAWDSGQNRSLRHTSNVGKSSNGAGRFKLSPALVAILFGILSMLLLPSSGRSQTVEELQQQIDQLQSEKGNLQQENNVLDAQICELISQMSTIDGLIQNGNGTCIVALYNLGLLYLDQEAERADLEEAQQMNSETLCTLEAALYSLDPESPTYQDDLNSINNAIQEVNNLLAENQERLDELDTAYEQAMEPFNLASQAVQGLQELMDELQQKIDALQSAFDSNNQRIQEIDSEIQSLQNQIDALNNM